jgi:isopenicillin N synthase-like dioxygenase
MAIPIVDLAKLCTLGDASPDHEDWTDAATAMREALQKIGFVYIKNHGIPQEKVCSRRGREML